MPVWMRRSLVAVALLAVFVGAAYYWLLVESRVPAGAGYELDIERVRRVAGAMPGERPVAVEVERVASFAFPATAIVAGDGWTPREMPIFAYRLVYPGGSIVVDTALDRAIGGDNLASFDEDAYSRVRAALSEASAIVITHEHMDHIGGLTAHPDLAAVLPSARLTRRQLEEPERSLPASFPNGALEGYEPLDVDGVHGLAPGVVLLSAPGHTPGSQMVYVARADGAELLFIGDVAWKLRNIELLRQRARLVTWLFLGEDRGAVFGQLAALRALREAEPGLAIVPGHDGEVVDRLVREGTLRGGFSVVSWE